MIICPDCFVFVSVTKCASQTLFPVLERYYGGYHHGHSEHCRIIEKWAEPFYTFSVCRNPYSRAVSLWYSTTQRHNSKGDLTDRYGYRAACPDPDDFAMFMRWITTLSHNIETSLETTQVDWLAGLRIDKFLRFESLDADFKTLPFYNGKPKALPRNNTTYTDRDPWQAYMTPQAIATIDKFYAADFDAHNYKRWGEL